MLIFSCRSSQRWTGVEVLWFVEGVVCGLYAMRKHVVMQEKGSFFGFVVILSPATAILGTYISGILDNGGFHLLYSALLEAFNPFKRPLYLYSR